jgi:membrane-bound metal-dependent hydrolase YbcI (DUF457 family)
VSVKRKVRSKENLCGVRILMLTTKVILHSGNFLTATSLIGSTSIVINDLQCYQGLEYFSPISNTRYWQDLVSY